ncbi:hypothetical protein HanPI659440_Chr06g0240731 [Helianthus annuus]|nr:hypothetical protein HanPI659440_Chr06g0240731 [Helianthus annuus]
MDHKKKKLERSAPLAQQRQARGPTWRNDLTFKDVVAKGVRGDTEKTLEILVETNAFVELHERALVGRTVDLDTLVSLRKLLTASGVPAREFLCQHDRWKDWFSHLDAWQGQSMPYERIAWLKVLRVPLNLVKEEVFRKIGQEFGNVLHVSCLGPEDEDLSVIRVANNPMHEVRKDGGMGIEEATVKVSRDSGEKLADESTVGQDEAAHGVGILKSVFQFCSGDKGKRTLKKLKLINFSCKPPTQCGFNKSPVDQRSKKRTRTQLEEPFLWSRPLGSAGEGIINNGLSGEDNERRAGDFDLNVRATRETSSVSRVEET